MIVLDSIIDLSLTIPSIRVFTPKTIFLGSFTYLLKKSQDGMWSNASPESLLDIKNYLEQDPSSHLISHHIELQM